MADLVTESLFVDLMGRLMTVHPDFSDVRVNVSRRWNDVYLRPDIACRHAGVETIVEVKGVTPFTSQRIEEVLLQLKKYQEAWPYSAIVVAIPGALSQRYRDVVEGAGISVWDQADIGRIFEAELREMDDQELRQAFQLGIPSGSSEASSLELALPEIRPGKEGWQTYQKFCSRSFEHLFSPPLEKPINERSDGSGANRRDIILPNYAQSGFWDFLRTSYGAYYVVIDSKNLKTKVGKPAVLQVANYLKEAGAGLFGIICSRGGFGKSASFCQKEQWLLHRKLILDLSDEDVLQMLINKRRGLSPELVIQQRIEDFRLGI